MQLAKERQEELEKTKVKEVNLTEKKNKEPKKKAYSSGVGKFINPSVIKEAK